MPPPLKRLNIIQDAIDLGDEDVITSQIKHLPPEMAELANLLDTQQYAEAAVWMTEYRTQNLMLTEYKDPELSGLQLEFSRLELRLTELITEKEECLRLIAEFNAAHMQHLGDLLKQILELQLQQAKAHANQEDDTVQKAKQQYEEFKQQQAETPEVTPLTNQQKHDLKKLFKQAAHRCHPDRLPDHKKEIGQKLFQQLEAAYRKNDLTRVQEIWHQLQSGTWAIGSATVTDKTLLRQRITSTLSRITATQAEIAAIHQDDTWQLIQSLAAQDHDWHTYFTQTKTSLQAKLAALKHPP